MFDNVRNLVRDAKLRDAIYAAEEVLAKSNFQESLDIFFNRLSQLEGAYQSGEMSQSDFFSQKTRISANFLDRINAIEVLLQSENDNESLFHPIITQDTSSNSPLSFKVTSIRDYSLWKIIGIGGALIVTLFVIVWRFNYDPEIYSPPANKNPLHPKQILHFQIDTDSLERERLTKLLERNPLTLIVDFGDSTELFKISNLKFSHSFNKLAINRKVGISVIGLKSFNQGPYSLTLKGNGSINYLFLEQVSQKVIASASPSSHWVDSTSSSILLVDTLDNEVIAKEESKITISGRVVNEIGEPIHGALIEFKNYITVTTQSDSSGYYELAFQNTGGVNPNKIIASALGYSSFEQSIYTHITQKRDFQLTNQIETD
ncbi:MAG: carboxypeptidase-like regulatory domain-containing protein [Bacteroidota bacterium]